uniref:Secreted protein n=1 Tax=Anopheles christyi TaxID=43041 RepID=A0A182JX74_9DIPT
MLRQHRFVFVVLACFAANCCSSSSEYLIIRHGRSRVRHSSEKDHIRWGLQVFDNFTLLDYDSGGSGSGSGSGSEETSPAKEPQTVKNGGGAGNTLTIRFDESEELERMIELSDFDNLRLNGIASRTGPTVPELVAMAPTTSAPTGRERKLIKKEIMENIRRTVDKGLEYLKSHNNLDEVKIEFVPFRGSTVTRKHSGKRIPVAIPSVATTIDSRASNRAEEQSSSSSSPAISTTEQGNRAASRKPGSKSLPWEDVAVAKNVQRPPNAQVSASNQRLISLDATPRTVHPVTATTLPLEQPLSSVMDARVERPYGWHRPGSRVVSEDGEDYPNDMPAAIDIGSKPMDDGPEDDEDRTDTNEQPIDDDGLLQDDDPLLQDAELDVPSEAEGADAADINNVFHMEESDLGELDETSRNNRRNLMKGRDVVTQFLQIVESQHLLGANCTAGTALNLGEGVVDRYAQDRFRVEAEIAVNRANMLTR